MCAFGNLEPLVLPLIILWLVLLQQSFGARLLHVVVIRLYLFISIKPFNQKLRRLSMKTSLVSG